MDATANLSLGFAVSFSSHGFPCRLSPLEVLRQTSSRAASRVAVRPFHFRQTQPSHSNRSLVCIGISARGGKNERRRQRK